MHNKGPDHGSAKTKEPNLKKPKLPKLLEDMMARTHTSFEKGGQSYNFMLNQKQFMIASNSGEYLLISDYQKPKTQRFTSVDDIFACLAQREF